MYLSMAVGAKSDQVSLGIVSQPASRLDVVNLELAKMPTVLATPAVPLQYLLPQTSVRLWVERKSGLPWAQSNHESFPALSRNCVL